MIERFFPIILLVEVLLVLSWLGRLVFNNPRGDFESGVLLLAGRAYAKLFHAMRVRGRGHVPRTAPAGRGLVVVANHTAGLDPILVQSACPFYIRWMMASDMRVGALEWFWSFWRIIFVDRQNGGGAALRQALRELRDGGAIGIFPEGGIERPPRRVMPFQEGVGLMIKKSGALVLPVVIEGTPQVDPAWSSLWRPSASVLTFHEPIDYSKSGLDSAGITADLRRRFLTWTGWPENDRVPMAGDGQGAPLYGRRVEGA